MEKYLDLTGEQRQPGMMRIAVIAIVVGALGAVPKDLGKRLEELEIRRTKTIQISALLRLVRIHRKVQ